ncbi:hypothetical protein ACHAXR_006031 [Thalassiosira sp. AJA248-18]
MAWSSSSSVIVAKQYQSQTSSRIHKQSSSALFSSPENTLENQSIDSSGNTNNDKNKKSPQKKKKQPIQALRRAILSFFKFLITFPSKFRSYYGKLTKKGKAILAVQMLAFGIIMGMGVRSSTAARVRHANKPVEVSYSTFLDLVNVNGKGHSPGNNPALKLENVVISKDRIGFRVITDAEKHAKLSQKSIYAVKPPASQDLIDTLREHDVPFRAASTKASNNLATMARISIFAVYILFLRKMYQTMGGGGGASGGGSGAPGKLATFSAGEKLVNFEDIEGIDDAKFEVMELVDTLRNPKKYEILGARAPTGLLLEGPPGTGKTMLARATAATAGVPLLYCSGSDFVEMFVGRGAARVRNTFARAGKLSPCIIFIDELDALGKSRDLGGLGANFRSNDEAEQTLNQLLACMDGLDSSRRVCVLAATNRREVLDPALIRPECKGVDEKRQGSLGMGAAIDLSAVAAVTRGLCGADLEFIVNEAAIRAVRRVSAKLRSGEDPKGITPTVSAEDFENSVVDFYETRKPKGGVGDIFNSVLGNK